MTHTCDPEAMMDATTTLMTATELLASHRATEPLELVAGVIRPVTPADAVHGQVAFNVMIAMGRHVSDHALGTLFTEQTGFLLRRNPDTVRCPDVAFVAARALPDAGVRHGWLETIPDLVVEIRSPSDRAAELGAKVREYLEVGVKVVWVIDSDLRLVTIHSADGVEVRGEADTLDAEEVIPGFRCAVIRLFDRIARE